MPNTGKEKWDELPGRVGMIDVDALRYHYKDTEKRLDQIADELDDAKKIHEDDYEYPTDKIKQLRISFNILINSLFTFVGYIPRAFGQYVRKLFGIPDEDVVSR